MDSVPEFSPPLEKIIDFSEIDAILISNYTCMLALPFITEGTGFKGTYFKHKKEYIYKIIIWNYENYNDLKV